MTDLAVVQRLVEAETAAQERIQRRTIALAMAELAAFSGWYTDALVARWSVRLGERVAAGSRAAATLTDAYLSRMIAEMIGGSPRPVGQIGLGQPLRRGVDSYAEVYARPAETVRYHQSTGAPASVAVEYATQRLDAMIQTDLQLARREQERATMSGTRQVTGHRRLIHPYLSKGGTCGLCVVASDRIYQVGELRDIHDRCKCTTAPIVGDDDPGMSLNSDDLELLYKAAGDTTDGRALKDVRVRYEDHSELGPYMVNASHRSKSPGRNRRGSR